MGSAKEHMFELAHERMIQWMRDTYSIAEDVDLDEDYPGYEGMASVYEHDERAAMLSVDARRLRWAFMTIL